MHFSNNYAKTIADFKLEDGVCEFTGPFLRKSLELCANDCQDFATIEEAMTRCLEIEECGGVTFSHMYWGDKKS